MSQSDVTKDINEASEHVAAELMSLRSELEILHIPSDLAVQKFADMIPEYYGSLFSQETLGLARRLVEEKFLARGTGISTKEVREAILAAVEIRDTFLYEKEGW